MVFAPTSGFNTVISWAVSFTALARTLTNVISSPGKLKVVCSEFQQHNVNCLKHQNATSLEIAITDKQTLMWFTSEFDHG